MRRREERGERSEERERREERGARGARERRREEREERERGGEEERGERGERSWDLAVGVDDPEHVRGHCEHRVLVHVDSVQRRVHPHLPDTHPGQRPSR
eukprot:166240-Rhodomonas_salina.1